MRAATDKGPNTTRADFALVPDCGGKIMEVALCIIASYFLPQNRAKLTPLANLIQSFDADTDVRLLVDDQSQAAANDFLAKLAHNCTVSVIATAPACPAGGENCLCDIFIQDKFSVADELSPDRRAMIRSAPAVYYGTLAADWIDIKNEYQKYSYYYWPEGGDCLVSDDFWIINTDIYLDGATKKMSDYDVFLRTKEARKLYYYGFTKIKFDKNYLMNALEEYDTTKRRKSYINIIQRRTNRRFTKEMLIQYFEAQLQIFSGDVTKVDPDLYHVDLLVAITGITDPETKASTILVGRPLDARKSSVKDELPQDWLDEHGWQYDDLGWARRAYEVKQALQNDGFKVIATPMPTIGKHWYTYNNVILENSPRSRVWLPQYGDEAEWLKQYDEKACEIWEALGFEVSRIYGWSAFLTEGGAVRCSSKVLRRA